MGLRKLPDTHSFAGWLRCNWCGYKTRFTMEGRSLMRNHLAARHPAPADVPPAEATP
jgi:hypothetical protein